MFLSEMFEMLFLKFIVLQKHWELSVFEILALVKFQAF